MSGLLGWIRKRRRREEQGISFYRGAASTLKTRIRKKLLDPVNWFKSKDKHEEEQRDNKEGSEAGRRRTEKRKADQEDQNRKEVKKLKKDEPKAVMFCPYTRGGELAKKLREIESEMEKTAGYRIKIVEETGDKIMDLLHSSNPWKGEDCGRERCWICETKRMTDKNKKQDCTKRSLVYETWCETCLRVEEDKIEKEEITEKEKEEKKRSIMRYKYIGETARSAYERGLEHRDGYEKLDEDNHMIKHVANHHRDMKLEDIKFGMKVLKYTNSAMERQILESVKIQEEKVKHYILNSKAEYSRCTLPRLTARMGEEEFDKKRHEEKKKERDEEEVVRKEVARRKKERCKNRGKEIHQQEEIEEEKKQKRRKINENGEYKSVIQLNKPEKNEIQEIEQETMTEVKRRKIETDTGIDTPPTETVEESTIPAIPQEVEQEVVHHLLTQTPDQSPVKPRPQPASQKIEKGSMIYRILGEEIRDAVLEDPIDWQKRRLEILARMENEEEMRRRKIEKAKKLQKSWELNNECRRLLKEYDRSWEEIKDDREKERKECEKAERIRRATLRKEEYKEKEKVKERDRKITEMLHSLPEVESERIEKEVRKEENRELQEIKRNLWKKWRGKNKIIERRTAIPKETEKIDKRLQEIEKKIEEYKERKEKKVQKSKEKREAWKKKHKMIVEDTWSMMRWITQYIDENKFEWEKRREREKEAMVEESERWKGMDEEEMIEVMKKHEAQEKMETETKKEKAKRRKGHWKEWRKKESTKEKESQENKDFGGGDKGEDSKDNETTKMEKRKLMTTEMLERRRKWRIEKNELTKEKVKDAEGEGERRNVELVEDWGSEIGAPVPPVTMREEEWGSKDGAPVPPPKQ